MATPAFSDCINKLGVAEKDVIPFGRNKAKISLDVLDRPAAPGKLILVSAITPTPSGEGKTTVSIGLAQGLQAIGKKVCLALRQPSMGPVFGRKGGATGGGKSSLTPAEEINMHFTGDFHAITSAHNLISAIIDNAMFFHTLNIDERKVIWKRVMDMNDRSLRSIIVGLNKQGFPRETGFDITPASEIMACLCLATSYKDMEERINRIVIGFTTDDKPVFARELGITGSVMALLKDALMPNLVQSVEGVPCFLHGGPFANIAHGCNSVLATRMALHFGDYAVTEAGFAFDLGAEKFLDIKCRQSGLDPAAIVIVATARALKMHGGTALADLKNTDVDALKKGLANLDAHLDAAAHYKRPVVVAVNKFFDDSREELDAIVKPVSYTHLT
ncbi:formate--tetrahydrofolate ligase, partial [uncultured Akkermansia sp.]|uniref:formate--tetrahydrofolate ligase n=1 Tax=uncultured Akkermansia sp. TaxID=512294 RepID=UPI002623AB8B